MDRKALIREYKETARPMGVFRVLNTTNGKALIGASLDLPAALNRQRAQLRLGAHPDRQMQSDWKQAGDAAFSFEVLDTLPPKDEPGWDPVPDLEALEALWREKLAPAGDPGYRAHGRIR